MHMHDDSITVILRSRPPVLQGFKAIYQLVRRNPNDTFLDLVDRLKVNGILISDRPCPYETEPSAPDRARVWLHFDSGVCLSTRVQDEAGELLLTDPIKCLLNPSATTRPCA